MEISSIARRLVGVLGRGPLRRGRLIAVLIIAVGGLVDLTSFVRLPIELLPRSSWLPFRFGPGAEPQATAQFLRGQQTFDAHLIWESYSDRVIQSLEERGTEVQDLQRQLDRLRQLGNPIQEVAYVGGHPIPRGSMEFYLVTRAGPCPTDRGGSQVRAPEENHALVSLLEQTCLGDPVYVPYVFTLDDKGKIDRVE